MGTKSPTVKGFALIFAFLAMAGGMAKRGDPQLLERILPAMKDDNNSVRFTAAAAVIRLSTLPAAKAAKEKRADSSPK